MAGNIFINYRRDKSGHVAGRLHNSLAPTFGRSKLFMDVDNIPVGRDFEDYLKSQVAACDAMLAVIGPNWLAAKDDTGKRRLDNPDDFIVIEIGTALTRNIPVVPVLVDGARMPKASELPDSLKLLARRQAIQVRHTSFSSDAEALVKRLREALGYDSPERRWRLRMAIGAAIVAALLLIGWGGYGFILKTDIVETFRDVRQRAEQDKQAGREAAVKAQQERQAAAEAKRKEDEAERQRLAKAEQERQAKAEQERQAKAEQERQAKAEQERQAKAEEERRRAETEASSRYTEAMKQGEAAGNAGDLKKAIANFNDAIRLNPKSEIAFYDRCLAYLKNKDFDLAIADCSEAIQLVPNYPSAFNNRGLAYYRKDDQDRAIADFSEAIQLGGATNSSHFHNRAFAYARKGDYYGAIADFDETIRLDPQRASAFCGRGIAKLKNNDATGNRDIAKARQLDASGCR